LPDGVNGGEWGKREGMSNFHLPDAKAITLLLIRVDSRFTNGPQLGKRGTANAREREEIIFTNLQYIIAATHGQENSWKMEVGLNIF
jgi:hypothetical protein